MSHSEEQLNRYFPKRANKPEERIHWEVVQYIKEQYPKVRFISNLSGAAFTSKTMAVQARSLQHSNGAPDLMIFYKNSYYSGLAIELKKGSVELTNKGGDWATTHIKEQAEWLTYLEDNKWKAEFAVGYDAAIKLIEDHMNDIEVIDDIFNKTYL